jgi:hypothetical protein
MRARRKRMVKRTKETVPALPRAISAATPLAPLSLILPRRRKGPTPGKLNRYGESDRALFPELKRLMREGHMSATAAARQLAEEGKVAGIGSDESRAHRLAGRYLADAR